MIQADNNGTTTAFLDIKDAINGSVKPLVELKSQQTNKKLFFIPSLFVITDQNRFCYFTFTSNFVLSIPTAGLLQMGNTDYPLGFYDVTVYKNTSNSNLDPSAANVVPVYYTLMNLFDSTKSPSTFNSYTTNDADTNSVYITI